MFEYLPSLVSFWIKFSSKSGFYTTLCIIIEFLTIWIECLNSFARLTQLDTMKKNFIEKKYGDEKLFFYQLNNINPIIYQKKLIFSEKLKFSDCSSSTCSINNTLILIIALLLTTLILIHHLWGYLTHLNSQKSEIKRDSNFSNFENSKTSNSNFLDFLNFLLINLLGLVFKVLGIFIFFIFFNKIFVSFYFNSDIAYAIISLVFLIFFTSILFFQINFILLFIRLDSHDSLQYDNFSKNYDALLIILKIIIALNNNLIFLNDGVEASETQIIRLITSLDYILIICLFNYTVKMLWNILIDKNLILVTNFYLNLFRLFNTLFLCVCIIINLFFKMTSVYELIITMISTLLISISILIFLCKKINIYLFEDDKKIYQLTNLINLFLEGDSAINQFTTTMIKVKSIHNINCKNKFLNNCLICQQSDIPVIISQEIHSSDKVNFLSTLFKNIELNTLHKLSSEEADLFKLINLIYEYNLSLVDSSIPRFSIIYKTKQMIKLNKDNKNNFYYNLLVFYGKINHQNGNEKELVKFSVIKNYDSSLVSLKNSIGIIKDIVEILDSKVKKDLYPQTNQLNKLKINLIKKFEEVNSSKIFFNDNFSFMMTKYIFEKTFNIEATSLSRVLEGSEDFDYRQDFIQDRFIKDKIITIKLDHSTNSLIISRASKEFSNFIGKNFESIFPEKFRELGKNKFLGEILNNQENFKFQFLIEKLNKIRTSSSSRINPSKYVQNIKLDCKIFRSQNLEEIFIISNYEISEEEILVFQTPIILDSGIGRIKKNSQYDFNKINLSNFSEQLEKILLVDPNFIETILNSKSPKKYLNFNDIFSKSYFIGENTKNISHDDKIQKNRNRKESNITNITNFNQTDINEQDFSNSSHSSNSSDEFMIDYPTYYRKFFSILEHNIHSLENGEDIHHYINICRVQSEKGYKIKCRVNFEYNFYLNNKNQNQEILIFSFKNISPKSLYDFNQNNKREINNNHDNHNSVSIIKNSENKMEINKNFADESSDNLLNMNNQLLDIKNEQGSSTSVSMSVSSAKTSQSYLNQSILSSISINGKKSTINESDKKMANFTIMTLFINFCLGLYCVFFLFMGFTSNNKMNELNLLKKNFMNFERMFYQTALSQFYNVGVYKKGTTNMDDYLFGGYWDQFAGKGLTISMGDYANSELYVKADILKEDLNTLQNFIYDPDSTYREQLDPIFNFDTVYKVLYMSEDNDLKLQARNPNFFETILMFMNNAKASVWDTTNQMIYIHNYDLHTGNYDFSTIFNKNITNVQKAVYEAIFNFPVYLNNLNKIWWQVEKLYYSQVDEIFNLNLYLSVILILLHVFLIIVSICIISFLKKIIGESNYIYAKVVTGDWSRYLTMKLLILNEMICFYKIDPIKNSAKLNKELKDSAKIIKDSQEKQKSQDLMYGEKSSFNDKSSTEEAHVSYENLISPLKKVLIVLFSFYLIYALSFIFIFDSSKSDILLTSKFASEYLQVDKGIMNSILLLQCILFSNQTDYSLNQYMKNYKNFTSDPDHKNGYIWNIIEDAKLSRNYISFLENNYPKIEKVEKKANQIAWCEYLYNNVDDNIFSVTKQYFPGNSLAENLIILCKHYPVMNLSYYKNLITEINYIAAKMTRSYMHSYPDYTKMKKTNDETEFFDEFTIAVMIIRPIQTYLLDNDIANLTKSTEENFVAIVIIFMIGNILVECLIFFVINRKLISRVLTINEEIRCLTLCLTA